MTIIDRRELSIGLASILAAGALPRGFASAAERPDTQVAIVDMSVNSTPWVKQLAKQRVQAVARYYAWGPQKGLAQKRLAFNTNGGGKPEWIALQEEGIGIISCYQYENNDRNKFLGDFMQTPANERKRLGSVLAPGSSKFENESNPKRAAVQDAQAALAQAKTVGQPDPTPIYFGVDFELDDYRWHQVRVYNPAKKRWEMKWQHALDARRRYIVDHALRDAVFNYFHKLQSLLGDRLGVYGGGYACEMLQRANLVSYTWVAESRSFAKTAAYLRSGDWTLFQNRIDTAWFYDEGTCAQGRRLELDTDVQNPVKNLGAWGGSKIDPQRTKDIFSSRQVAVAKDGVPIYSERREHPSVRTTMALYNADNGKFECARGTAQRNRTVRVLGPEENGWLHVDVNDDGKPDGFCRVSDAARRPNFVNSILEMPNW